MIDSIVNKYLNEEACLYQTDRGTYVIKYNVHHHEFKASDEDEAKGIAKEYMSKILPMEIDIVDIKEEEE